MIPLLFTLFALEVNELGCEKDQLKQREKWRNILSVMLNGRVPLFFRDSHSEGQKVEQRDHESYIAISYSDLA